MCRRILCLVLLGFLLLMPSVGQSGYDKTFDAGSLIVPMDLAYQDHGMFQAYGLLFQLLRQEVTVYWIIDPEKEWHETKCDTPGQECGWDCLEEGSGVKCSYPTASPDFYTSAKVVWDGEGQASPGDEISSHGYRGGPFVIDSAESEAALSIVNIWNDQSLWSNNPWAQRTVFHVVSVHEATASFSGFVRKEMVAAPTIAVFADGHEAVATSYLRAAGIPQSNGNEFPEKNCDDPANEGECGPGTSNPDMLTVPSIMGDMGTCDNPNYDHKNGALFTEDGVPAYCQIMSMHWEVGHRNTVECDGGACPATQEECNGETFTYHGHEVVAEVRQFLHYPVHFFAECQAVNAYENTTPNPAWPYLDDEDRMGHFLTTTGNPPDCTHDDQCVGTDTNYECDEKACDHGTRDCCQPKEEKEKGAGFLIEAQPDENSIQILYPQIPYNQLDGTFGTVKGSESSYNLSDYLQTKYKNDLDVTFITGPDGPGDHDVWMTGFLDGDCWIGCDDDSNPDCIQAYGEPCRMGKVSYLGGHSYLTGLPLSSNIDSQGTRLFLNALLEADCVTTLGQPSLGVAIQGDTALKTSDFPVEETYTVSFVNSGPGAALDAVVYLSHPANVSVSEVQTGGVEDGDEIQWSIGTIGSAEGQMGDPASSGSRFAKLSFPAEGEYLLEAWVEYRVGVNTFKTVPATLTFLTGPDVEDPGGGGGGGGEGGDGEDPSDDEPSSSGCSCGSESDNQGIFTAFMLLLAIVLVNRFRSRFLKKVSFRKSRN